MKNHINTLLLLFTATLLLMGCTEKFEPETSEEDQQLVVEGFVEAGEGSMPVFVLITKSIPFLSTIDINTFNTLFVNDAKVIVSDGINDVELTELCLDDLPPEIREEAAMLLGFNPDSITVNFCAYVDLFDEVDRKIGGEYDLNIEVEESTITASTTIPDYVPIYDFRWDDPPGEPSDTIARLWVTIDDPEGNTYYRYFTEENDDGLIAPFTSVTNDAFFDNQTFEFPLTKAEPAGIDFDPNTFGFYNRGDSITIKWTTLDEAHFNFWNTLEFNANNTGPFSSYTRVSSNVDGALGVWGGYAVGYYRDYVPFK